MHRYVNTVRRHIEQSGSLNNLESLVHQGRGVDGHDRAHVPRRMMQCLLGRDVRHIGTFPASERTTGGCDHQLGDLGMGAGTQRLPDGGMFGVDRIDLIVAHLRAEQQMTAGHH